MYYKVTFKHSENVFCTNIAIADSVEAVKDHYSKYSWSNVRECAEWEVEEGKTKGMPIITIETKEEPETVEAKGENTMFEKIADYINTLNCRSAWRRGVRVYALELLEELEEHYSGGYVTDEVFADSKALEKALLNGADNWEQYSWGGCSLIYDSDIAERLCTPSELKRTRGGERRPNRNEEWLDCQARALFQAARMIRKAVNAINKGVA